MWCLPAQRGRLSLVFFNQTELSLMRRIFPVLCLVAGHLFAGQALANESAAALPYFPGSQYNSTVPTVQQALGYALGSRITEPAAVSIDVRCVVRAQVNGSL